jgi:hypothetical protein
LRVPNGQAPPLAARPWRRAGAAVAGLWTAAHLLPGQPGYLPVIGDLGALPAGAIIVGGPAHLGVRRRTGVDASGTWALAGAGCAVMFLPERLAFLGMAWLTRNDPLAGSCRWRPPPSN